MVDQEGSDKGVVTQPVNTAADRGNHSSYDTAFLFKNIDLQRREVMSPESFMVHKGKRQAETQSKHSSQCLHCDGTTQLFQNS